VRNWWAITPVHIRLDEHKTPRPPEIVRRTRWSTLRLERGRDRFGFSICARVGPPDRYLSTERYRIPCWGFTLDIHDFWGASDSLYLWGRRINTTIGLRPGKGHQVWSWRRNRWVDRSRWIVIYPSDHLERGRKTGKGPMTSYIADCHREGRYWAIHITSSSLDGEPGPEIGITQARIGHREVESMAKDYIRTVRDMSPDDPVDLTVFGAHFWNGVRTDRWQYHAPWANTRPWLPKAYLTTDERGNEGFAVNVPPVGEFVFFFRCRIRTEELTNEQAEEFELATPNWWAPTQTALNWVAVPLYVGAVALTVRAIRRRR